MQRNSEGLSDILVYIYFLLFVKKISKPAGITFLENSWLYPPHTFYIYTNALSKNLFKSVIYFNWISIVFSNDMTFCTADL